MVDFLDAVFLPNVATELNHDDPQADIRSRLERAFLFTDIQSRMMGVQTSGATVALCLVDVSPCDCSSWSMSLAPMRKQQ